LPVSICLNTILQVIRSTGFKKSRVEVRAIELQILHFFGLFFMFFCSVYQLKSRKKTGCHSDEAWTKPEKLLVRDLKCVSILSHRELYWRVQCPGL